MRLFLIISLCLPLSVYSNDREQALQKVREAVMNLEGIKDLTNRIVRKVDDAAIAISPINPRLVKAVGPIAWVIANGEINTNKIKDLSISTFSEGRLRPDIYYNLKNDHINGQLMFSWEF